MGGEVLVLEAGPLLGQHRHQCVHVDSSGQPGSARRGERERERQEEETRGQRERAGGGGDGAAERGFSGAAGRGEEAQPAAGPRAAQVKFTAHSLTLPSRRGGEGREGGDKSLVLLTV